MNVLYKEIAGLIRNNQLADAFKLTRNKLQQLPLTDFHYILEIEWLPLAENVALYIEKFYKSAKRKLKLVEAIYCEMNAFTINYDNWFVQFFAYEKYMGTEDFDWLADYDYTQDNALLFTGLERIQSIFKDYIENEKWKDKNMKEAFDVSEYIIILGVQRLFREAYVIAKNKKFNWVNIPVFVNAHDYDDLIYNVTN